MIRIAIVEDEENAIDALKSLLEYSKVLFELLGTASSHSEAVQLIEEKKPQLLFLDIQLTDCSGFDVLKDLIYREMEIIFTTAFNQFAIEAFEEHAVGYLLKPIDPELFMRTFTRACSLVDSKKLYHQVKNYDSIITRFAQRFSISTMEGTRYLDTNDVIQIRGDGSYSHIHLKNGEVVMVSKNIGHFEDELKELGFIRCHRSHLVNPTHITGFIKRGGNKLKLSNGDTAAISRARKEEMENFRKKTFPK